MINDFILKLMHIQTATLDIYDFTYGILMGLLERHVPIDNIDNTILNFFKVKRELYIRKNSITPKDPKLFPTREFSDYPSYMEY